MQREYDVQVEWRSFLLRPDTPPEGRPFPYPKDRYEEMSRPLKQMAAEVGLPIVDHEWIPNSRLALEASEFARGQGKFDAFHHAVFHAYFAEDRNIGDVDVLRDLARDVGLDDDALAVALNDGRYRAAVDDDYQLAQRIGFSGVPAFIIGNRGVVGAQPYEVFEYAMQLAGATRRDGTSPASASAPSAE